jgi:rubrerythrin
MDDAITPLLLAPGLGVVVYALLRHRPSPPADPEPELPIAKVEDGRPLVAARRSRGPKREHHPSPGLFFLGLVLMFVGGFLGMLAGLGSSMESLGRPVRVRGRKRLPRRALGSSDGVDPVPRIAGLGWWRRARLGARWHAAAREEHASIPAFERLAAQLARLGAPAELVDRCHAAAADETRHARRCFALARAYSGIDWTAGELRLPAVPAPDLAALAVESLVDGCLGEGVAADVARAGATKATDPVIAETLATIADDEAGHAELAWSIVELCVARGGAEVRRAIAGAALPAPRPSRGVTDLDRATLAAIAAERSAAVRARLAALAA